VHIGEECSTSASRQRAQGVDPLDQCEIDLLRFGSIKQHHDVLTRRIVSRRWLRRRLD